MNILLPYKFKTPGYICTVVAVVLSVVYFYFRLQISVPVFAVISSNIETNIFTIFETNFFEKLIMLIFVAGFSLVVFSREKEEARYLRIVRIMALKRTIAAYILWMILSIIFVYGNAFIAVLVINIISPFIIYLIIFNTIKYRELKKNRLRKLQNKLAKSISQSA